jgi:voltage-gated potassium channel
MPKEFKTLYYGTLFLISIVAFGTTGYMIFENYNFLDAIYMTLITISTVGFREVRELSDSGKYFTLVLIMSSFGVFGYILTSMARVFFDGDYKKIINYYKVKRKIEKFSGHVIICGFGRNGRKSASELLLAGKKIVVFDQNASVFEDTIDEEFLNNPNLLYFVGDAAHEETLMQGNPEKAAALITTLPNDAENLLIVLTVNQINPKIKIISRASDDHSYSKLIRAGASNVIMPDIVGGVRMAKLVTEPDVVEFLELIMLREGVDVEIAEIACSELMNVSQKATIAEMDIRNKTGVSMIGLKRDDGEYIFNPSADMHLYATDKMFVLGKPEQLEKLRQILRDHQ